MALEERLAGHERATSNQVVVVTLNYRLGMLGWFRMTPEISIEDVEWMLARSAAFDAGYALVTSYEALEGNGFADRILAAIGAWEKARMRDVFSADQKSRMEDVGTEFTLGRADSDDPADWALVEIHRVLRHGGIAYLVLPDKNLTWDRMRETTATALSVPAGGQPVLFQLLRPDLRPESSRRRFRWMQSFRGP